ncbi:MAG: hypothetical protein HYV07_21135 [Deltaproteobacteria bacterium]|nr:hypothetical protein [Deltaproteobacteria bacterium]
MGKKARLKRERNQNDATGAEPNLGAGDLRLLDILVADFMNGVPEAETTLKIIGRDAAHTVTRMGEQKGHAGLIELGKKLIAIRPQVETNLLELRRASVSAHLERAEATAPLATDGSVDVGWHSVAIFDPACVVDDLAKGGRPRQDPKRIVAGDIAWFSLAPDAAASIRFTTAEPQGDEPGLRLKLRVASGLVYVGPPEASDGPRLGEVRLDPFTTRFDEHLSKGQLVKLKPGDYELRARRLEPGQLEVRIRPWSGDDITVPPEGLQLQ